MTLCILKKPLLINSVSADKRFPDLIFPSFMLRISICLISYVMTYLPITVDNKTQKGLPFNHVIKCGRKFFGLISQAQAATTTRSCKARKPHFVGQSCFWVLMICNSLSQQILQP